MKTNFIDNDKLKKRVEDSVEYIFTLFKNSENSDSETFKSETNRVIVLYCVSIIEALMFLIYDRQEKRIYKQEYKDSSNISKKFIHKDYTEDDVVISVRRNKEKVEPEINFVELLDFLKECKVLKGETVDRIKYVNQRRNTFHLRKEGLHDCSKEDVEEALSLLELAIKHTPRFVRK